MPTTPTELEQNLRKRAEEKFLSSRVLKFSPEDKERLFHEPQVHQIELEMQNEELQSKQSELQSALALYDMAPIGYLVLNEKWVIQEVNVAAAAMLGMSRDLILNKSITQYIFHEDQKVYSDFSNNLTETNVSKGCELRLVNSNGSIIWVLLQATSAGNNQYWITLSDVSERKYHDEKRMEKDLQFLETLGLERYRSNMDAIFRTVSEAIIMVDNDGRLAHFNEAAEEICGYNSSLLGREITEIGLGFSSLFCTILLETLSKNTPHEIDRFERRTPEGKMQSFSLRTTPVTESDGTVSGAVAVIRDETRLMVLERTLQIRGQFHGIVGASAPMQRLYALIEALADVPTTLLINGESGTGKELVAAALQSCGKQFKGPFVKVNCSALSESLLESELFGHVRGAFTGAIADKIGRFKKADGGTLLLDEIGDISPAIQMRLLRVLQESEFERVGDSTPIRVSVRIIAATNKNLEEKVRLGFFRQDLYYRLNVICIELPPLRDRLDDLELLVTHFITRFNNKFDRKIQGVTDNVMDLFRAHDWPGNIRELEHVIERAVILCTSNTISANDLPNAVMHDCGHTAKVTSKTTTSSKSPLPPKSFKETMVLTNGNKTHAARLLGISRPTLYKLLNKTPDL